MKIELELWQIILIALLIVNIFFTGMFYAEDIRYEKGFIRKSVYIIITLLVYFEVLTFYTIRDWVKKLWKRSYIWFWWNWYFTYKYDNISKQYQFRLKSIVNHGKKKYDRKIALKILKRNGIYTWK